MDADAVRWKQLEWRPGEPVPLILSLPLGTWKQHRQALLDVLMEFEDVAGWHSAPEPRPWERESLGWNLGDTYKDAWGCQIRNAHDGLDGLVVGHPLSDWSAFSNYRVPDIVQFTDEGEERDWDAVKRSFDLIRAEGRSPMVTIRRCFYQRLHTLRGYENFFVDVAQDDANLHRLADMIVEANLCLIDRYLELGARSVSFSDHIGMQDRFPMGLEAWDRVFQPRYERMFAPVRNAGGRVSFYSDGHMVPVWDRLIRAGATKLRVQENTNPLDDMVRLLKGRVAITYDLDRQELLPRGAGHEIDDKIRVAIETLGSPAGGLAVCAGIYPDTPLVNLRAVLAALRLHRDRWLAATVGQPA